MGIALALTAGTVLVLGGGALVWLRLRTGEADDAGEVELDLEPEPGAPRVVSLDEVDGPDDDPAAALRRARDRVAAQAAAAFAELHRLRTKTLQRAAQAEHHAVLAASARTRALRDARPETDDGLRTDVSPEVHRLRREAMRRATEAKLGVDAVAQARQRAGKLLAEQRRLEAQMHQLERARTRS
jgi:hypothetical protein